MTITKTVIDLPTNKYTFTLIAKDGYSINNEESFISNEFTAINNLIIDKYLEPTESIFVDEILVIGTNNTPITSDTIKTLKKIFQINPSDEQYIISGIKIKRQGSGTQNITFILTPQHGYTINGTSNEYRSSIFNGSPNIINLSIIKKPGSSIYMSLEEYRKIKENNIASNFEIVARVFSFNNMTENELNRIITIDKQIIDLETNKYQLTLRAYDGYTINGQKTLVSNTFTASKVLKDMVPINFSQGNPPVVYLSELSLITEADTPVTDANATLIKKIFYANRVSPEDMKS